MNKDEAYDFDTGMFRISAQSVKAGDRCNTIAAARSGEEMVVLTQRANVDELRQAFENGAIRERYYVLGHLHIGGYRDAADAISSEPLQYRESRRQKAAAETYRYPTVRRRRTVKIEGDKLPNGSQSPLFLRVDDRGGLTYRYADDSGLFHSLAVALADRRSMVCADINVFIAEGAKLLAEPDEDVEG